MAVKEIKSGLSENLKCDAFAVKNKREMSTYLEESHAAEGLN